MAMSKFIAIYFLFKFVYYQVYLSPLFPHLMRRARRISELSNIWQAPADDRARPTVDRGPMCLSSVTSFEFLHLAVSRAPAGDITVITSHGIGGLCAARCEPYAHMVHLLWPIWPIVRRTSRPISHMGHNWWTKWLIKSCCGGFCASPPWTLSIMAVDAF